MNIKGSAVLFIGAIALAGCNNMSKTDDLIQAQFSDKVDMARQLPPPGKDWSTVRDAPANGTSFAANLSRDYKSLMLFEKDQMYDDVSAEMYAERALATARGQVVQPVDLADFNLPEAHRDALVRARAGMMDLFAKGAPTKFPKEAAKLQSSFDCWAEQQEENHQPDHIAACRNEFVAAMKALSDAMAEKPVAATPAPAPAATFKDSYVIYFAFDSSQISSESAATVAEVIRAIQSQNAGASIIGYADTVGSSQYNIALSQRRAKAIADQILNAGVRPAVVTTEGRGESELAVPTADNVREARNRRAVINIR